MGFSYLEYVNDWPVARRDRVQGRDVQEQDDTPTDGLSREE